MQGVGEDLQRFLELGLVQVAGVVAQVFQRGAEGIRRRRPAQRDGCGDARSGRGHRDRPLTEDGLRADCRQRLIADVHVTIHGEGDLGGVTGERDRLHLANFDTRDVDVVAGVDSAGVGEVGGVGPALRPERQAGVAERDQDDARHKNHSEDPGAEWVAVAALGATC
jgi:hypothetical protein